MEQKWELSKQGMVELQTWLTCHGIPAERGGEVNRITMVVKPNPKCKFCGIGERYHGSLCEFCYRCVPYCASDGPASTAYPQEEWIKMFRDTARSARQKGLLK